MKDGTERTPLAIAVEYNHCDFARELLCLEPRAADVNLVLPDGETALTLAAKNTQYDGTEMVRVLLARGADPTCLESLLHVGEEDGGGGDDAGESAQHHLNRTMRYWVARARERRRFNDTLLRKFRLDGLREVEFAVVGEQAATKQMTDRIIHWRGQPAARSTPLVMWIVGAPGHGKTYFSRNLARALVGADNFLFVPMGSVRSDRQLFGVQWAGQNDDGMITAFLRTRQDRYTVVMLDEMEKPKDLVNEGGWDQSRPIYKSFLEPWQEGTIQNPGQQGHGAAGQGNLSAGHRARSIDCSKCIFICTTNLCQAQIVDFAKEPTNARRIHESGTHAHDGAHGAAALWIEEQLVRKIIEPQIFAFFRRINEELQALVRRIDCIVPFMPLAPEERVVVADMELRRFFLDFRHPPQWDEMPGKPQRLAGNLLVRHTDDVADLCAEAYDPMQGASSMHKACQAFTAPITVGYATHEWARADVVKGPIAGGYEKGAQLVDLRRLWLHVPDDDMKQVAVSLVKPPPKRKPEPARAGRDAQVGTAEARGAAAAQNAEKVGGVADEDDVDDDF
eukprot:g1925.t1